MKSKRMENRITLITGGGTGIGKAIAKLFASEGSSVVISGRRDEPLKNTTNEIQLEGGDCEYIQGDVANIIDAQRMVEFTVTRYGTVDTLINSAGIISRTEKVEETTDEEWANQVDINLRGVFHMTKFCLPLMMEQNMGAIVNIGSICATIGIPGYATYCATKGGVLAYTRVIALQYAEYRIRANVISPGMVHTPMSYVDRPNFDNLVDGLVETLYPIRRLCLPKDVAFAALYLASDESSYVTGHNLVVDGGFTIK